MDKSDLKKILKPLIKESIKEILIEQGILSFISETKTSISQKEQQTTIKESVTKKPVINEVRKKMLEEIGKSGYVNNKFDPFIGTKPLSNDLAPSLDSNNSVTRNSGPPAMKNIDPHDPGIDISGLMNTNKQVWNALVGRKGK